MSYEINAHIGKGKLFIMPVGSEPLSYEGDDMVYGNDEGVGRTTYIGTFDADGLVDDEQF